MASIPRVGCDLETFLGIAPRSPHELTRAHIRSGRGLLIQLLLFPSGAGRRRVSWQGGRDDDVCWQQRWCGCSFIHSGLTFRRSSCTSLNLKWLWLEVTCFGACFFLLQSRRCRRFGACRSFAAAAQRVRCSVRRSVFRKLRSTAIVENVNLKPNHSPSPKPPLAHDTSQLLLDAGVAAATRAGVRQAAGVWTSLPE